MSLRSWRRALWWRARCEWGCTRLDTTNCACTQQDRVAVPVSAPWWKEIARIHHRMVRLPSWEGFGLLLHRLLYCVWCQPRRAFEVCAPTPREHYFCLYIPHKLLDPVLDTAKRGLERFLQTTFWENLPVLMCCQAAQALAKRGESIDRYFIGIGPGGVGQSLYSTLLAAMYCHNHAFIDPNLWFQEDELRKQIEQFAHCFIFTGQEPPQGHRRVREDRCKKTMSANGIAGRKPFGAVTRMLSLVGWKRMWFTFKAWLAKTLIRCCGDLLSGDRRRDSLIAGPPMSMKQLDYLLQTHRWETFLWVARQFLQRLSNSMLTRPCIPAKLAEIWLKNTCGLAIVGAPPQWWRKHGGFLRLRKTMKMKQNVTTFLFLIPFSRRWILFDLCSTVPPAHLVVLYAVWT